MGEGTAMRRQPVMPDVIADQVAPDLRGTDGAPRTKDIAAAAT
jgi:hypothetical protein